MASEFFANSDVFFGKDAIKELPGMLKSYQAKNVMVLHGGSVKRAGIADIVLEEAKKALKGFQIEYSGNGEKITYQSPNGGYYIKEGGTVKLMLE